MRRCNNCTNPLFILVFYNFYSLLQVYRPVIHTGNYVAMYIIQSQLLHKTVIPFIFLLSHRVSILLSAQNLPPPLLLLLQ